MYQKLQNPDTMDRVRALRRPELAHLEELPRHPCCRTVRATLRVLMWQRDHIAAYAVELERRLEAMCNQVFLMAPDERRPFGLTLPGGRSLPTRGDVTPEVSGSAVRSSRGDLTNHLSPYQRLRGLPEPSRVFQGTPCPFRTALRAPTLETVFEESKGETDNTSRSSD